MNGEPTTMKPDMFILEACCDCNLVHLVLYEIKNGKIVRTVYRDDWETEKDRRERGTVVYHRKKKEKK